METADTKDPARLADLFRSGEEHVQQVVGRTSSLFPGWKPEGAALDFGSGAGRLSVALAQRFDRVVGVDVSAGMRSLAVSNSAHMDNLGFVPSVADAVALAGSFDFLNSYIVLQHLRPSQGLPIIDEMLHGLNAGGACALHVIVGDSKRRRGMLNSVRYRVPAVHWAYNLRVGRPWREPITEMNTYSVLDLLRVFRDNSIPDPLFAPFDQSGYVGCMIYARKS